MECFGSFGFLRVACMHTKGRVLLHCDRDEGVMLRMYNIVASTLGLFFVVYSVEVSISF